MHGWLVSAPKHLARGSPQDVSEQIQYWRGKMQTGISEYYCTTSWAFILFVVCEVAENCLRTAEIPNMVWLVQSGNISVKSGNWSAFKIHRTIHWDKLHPFSLIYLVSWGNTCGLGKLSYVPNFSAYLPRLTRIKSPHNTWTSINSVFPWHNLLLIKSYKKRRNSIILR